MHVQKSELPFSKLKLDGEIRTDETTRRLYATDASAYQELPAAVAVPRTEADIQQLIRFADEYQIGLIPRTAGTSLAGQVVGAGIVVDVSRHFTRIVEINSEQGWVRVQPGVIRDELNQALAAKGLMFGPETSTSNRAMIGGMLGNNSCGSNSIEYGTTRDNTLEVRGFLSDGSGAVFSALSESELDAKCDPSISTLESNIYRSVRTLLADPQHRDEIRREFPHLEIHRRNTGYAVDVLMDASVLGKTLGDADVQPSDAFVLPKTNEVPFDFCKLIAGSEGTLFFATEIKLRCLPLPPPVEGILCVHFETTDQALRATPIAMTHSPFECELIDRFVLEGAARNLEQRENAQFVTGSPGAILMVSFRADDSQQVLEKTKLLTGQLESAGLGYHFPILFGDEVTRARDLRKSGLGVVSNVPGDAKPYAFIEDTAVRVADLADFIAEFNQILDEKYKLKCVHYGHAGAGEIHLRPILNLKTQVGKLQFRQIAADIAQLVKKYRGSLSGEHGDGRLRAEFLQQMVGEKNYQLLRQIKDIWDPHHVFNPNKIIDAPPMNEGLRYQPDQPEREIETVFDFSDQQGVLRAAELCNGSGDCRKTHLSGGTMCPSYMATRNEADTTRARANILRQVLTHPSDQQHPFNDPSIKEVMDLCLSCKGCKRECPSNVDVAKLKAEFLQGYYDANGVPWRAKTIARFASHMQLASNLPWLYNWLSSSFLTAPILKRIIGFAPKRSLPAIDRVTLRKWFDRHEPYAQSGSRGKVYLLCDEFTNFNDTEIGIATVHLLERIGYEIELANVFESGRAAISKGLLRDARQIADCNVSALATSVSTDVPLIGIEPSALLSFRDEYPQLVSTQLRDQAHALAGNCLLIDEFITRQIDEGILDAGWFTDQPKVIRLHGHCHQKALASLAPTVRMLGLPKNYSVRLIPSGCCGMAGSFGFETEHYEVSMKIGELVLFPTVRNEPADSLIAAPGTSCRHQILDGTGRKAFHPAEILNAALK